MLTGASVGRWLVVRVLGVRGVPFPFGANARWCWTTASVVPQALGLLGSLAGMYAVPGAAIAAGTWSAGVVEADETSMRLVVDPKGPAFDADVWDGDRVLSVNGERMTSWDAFRGAVARHPGEAIDLSV